MSGSGIQRTREIIFDVYSIRAMATPYPDGEGSSGEYEKSKYIEAVFEVFNDRRIQSVSYEGKKINKVVVDLKKLSKTERDRGWIEGILVRTSPDPSPHVTEENWKVVRLKVTPTRL